MFFASLTAVDPYMSVNRYAGAVTSIFREGKYQRCIVVSFGKAACHMAKAVEDACGDIVDTGIAITKYAHCITQYRPQGIRVFEAGHPLPDEHGVRGTSHIINLLREADENALVVCLISGGGSALLVSPHKDITLNAKQSITSQLLNAGADIFEVNTVRKHLSNVKGGRLAELAYPARTLSFILSDVIGDRLDVIASGPTSPDPSSYNDALEVLRKLGLLKTAPFPIVTLLEKGITGQAPETPKENDRIFSRVENIIIGSNRIALAAAKEKAAHLGLSAEITSSDITGEARDVGRALARRALEIRKTKSSSPPLCLISGGETTVTVKGTGKGGRNTELALAFATEVQGTEGLTLLSAGTDGTDGPTDAAGAIVNGQTVSKGQARGLDPGDSLRENDSYHFLKDSGDLLITGPTGTNVMDIQLTVIE